MACCLHYLSSLLFRLLRPLLQKCHKYEDDYNHRHRMGLMVHHHHKEAVEVKDHKVHHHNEETAEVKGHKVRHQNKGVKEVAVVEKVHHQNKEAAECKAAKEVAVAEKVLLIRVRVII